MVLQFPLSRLSVRARARGPATVAPAATLALTVKPRPPTPAREFQDAMLVASRRAKMAGRAPRSSLWEHRTPTASVLLVGVATLAQFRARRAPRPEATLAQSEQARVTAVLLCHVKMAGHALTCSVISTASVPQAMAAKHALSTTPSTTAITAPTHASTTGSAQTAFLGSPVSACRSRANSLECRLCSGEARHALQAAAARTTVRRNPA